MSFKAMWPGEIVEKAKSLLRGKGADYGERGKNFREAAVVASILRGKEIDAMDVAACLIGVKCSRYGNLTGGTGKTPANEGVLDTVVDGINYFALLEELRQLRIEKADQAMADILPKDAPK